MKMNRAIVPVLEFTPRKELTEDHVYPEVTGYWVAGKAAPPPTFPQRCPACGAVYAVISPAVHEVTARMFLNAVVTHDQFGTALRYACGGKYKLDLTRTAGIEGVEQNSIGNPESGNPVDLTQVTFVWFGECPKRKRCDALGLDPSIPERVLQDAERDAGLRDW